MSKDYKKRAEILLDKLQKNTESDEERALIKSWLAQKNKDFDAVHFSKHESQELFSRIKQQIQENSDRRRRLKIIKYSSMAAALLIFSAIAIYVHQFNRIDQGNLVLQQDEILPGTEIAVLELSNGQKIELDSSAIANPLKGISIDRQHGVITFSNADVSLPSQDLITYNTVRTQNAGQYTVVLPDGSIAKLNANSSIRFPSNFTSNRRSQIAGEVHFQVLRDENNPFVVETDFQLVKVLGTTFNIKSYMEDQLTHTSLIEGQLFVQSKSNPEKEFLILRAGESAINGHNQVLKKQTINIQKEEAWKHGSFHFDGESIQEVLTTLARWYNVRINYEFQPDSSIHYGGVISRNKKLSTILSLLEERGDVKLTIKGKEVLVQQK